LIALPTAPIEVRADLSCVTPVRPLVYWRKVACGAFRVGTHSGILARWLRAPTKKRRFEWRAKAQLTEE
jgi:hypothetical protein